MIAKFSSVVFQGQPLILIRFLNGEGALAYPHQVENDNIRPECHLEPGFAHIDSDGQIWRLGNCCENANTHPDLRAAWCQP